MTPEERIFNIGGSELLTVGEIARIGSRLAHLPSPAHVPFPGEQRAIDIGSYYTCSARFNDATGWVPRVPFAEGFGRSLRSYQARPAA